MEIELLPDEQKSLISDTSLECEKSLQEVDAAKDRLKNLYDQSVGKLSDLLEYASDSQDARLWANSIELLKALADINSKIVTGETAKATIRRQSKMKIPEDVRTLSQTNNNFFVGTTEELRKVLDEQL